MRRSISDRMSYRNHYMCSGEATSLLKGRTGVESEKLMFNKTPLPDKMYVSQFSVKNQADPLFLSENHPQ